MIDDCRQQVGTPNFEKNIVNTQWLVAGAHASVHKGANFSRTGKSRCWVGDWTE